MQDSPGVRANSLPVAADTCMAAVIDHNTINVTKTRLKTIIAIATVCPGNCLIYYTITQLYEHYTTHKKGAAAPFRSRLAPCFPAR